MIERYEYSCTDVLKNSMGEGVSCDGVGGSESLIAMVCGLGIANCDGVGAQLSLIAML